MSAIRQTLDVSPLPGTVLDHRSPIWWANTLLIVIETTLFAILVAAYFYLRQNFTQWPPVQTQTTPPIFHPVPKLGYSWMNLAVISASYGAMLWADRSALARQSRGVAWGLLLTVILGLAAIAVRWGEFFSLRFHWDDNAYASIVWTILGMHAMHLIIGTCENALMLAWVMSHGLDDKHARDVHITSSYWYWIGIIWVPLWLLVFVFPRFT